MQAAGKRRLWGAGCAAHLQGQLQEGVVLQAQTCAVLGVRGAQRLDGGAHGGQPGLVPAVHKLPAAKRQYKGALTNIQESCNVLSVL